MKTTSTTLRHEGKLIQVREDGDAVRVSVAGESFGFRKINLDGRMDEDQDTWAELMDCLVHIYGPRKGNAGRPNCMNSDIQDFFDILARHA